MTPQELKEYYKTGYRFYKETGISQSSFSNWLRWGYIPKGAQAQIQLLTGGALKLSEDTQRHDGKGTKGT